MKINDHVEREENIKNASKIFDGLPDGSEFFRDARKEYEENKWNKIELLDKLSAHDEEWLVENEARTKLAIGVYSCGELVEIMDDVRR